MKVAFLAAVMDWRTYPLIAVLCWPPPTVAPLCRKERPHERAEARTHARAHARKGTDAGAHARTHTFERARKYSEREGPTDSWW